MVRSVQCHFSSCQQGLNASVDWIILLSGGIATDQDNSTMHAIQHNDTFLFAMAAGGIREIALAPLSELQGQKF